MRSSIPVLALAALLLCGAGSSHSERHRGEVDGVDVLQVGERVLAVISRTDRTLALPLQLGERVVGLASQGAVGVALTDHRLLALHTRSQSWQELPLRLEERRAPPGEADVMLTDRFVLVPLPGRVVAFSARSGAWSQLALTPAEQVVRRVVDEEVAALVTSRRAIGFAASGGFSTTLLNLNEGLPSVSSEDRSVTLVTERRVLVFTAPSGHWRELRRNLRF